MPRTSTTGILDQALTLQVQTGVQERFCGSWFHVSQNPAIEAFSDEGMDEASWTFFTRSPYVGANWGRYVVQVLFIAPAFNSRVTQAGHGDVLGQEGGRTLQDWWLIVGQHDIEKLMVVQKYHLVNNEDVAIALRDSVDFQALRQSAIARLPAPDASN